MTNKAAEKVFLVSIYGREENALYPGLQFAEIERILCGAEDIGKFLIERGFTSSMSCNYDYDILSRLDAEAALKEWKESRKDV